MQTITAHAGGDGGVVAVAVNSRCAVPRTAPVSDGADLIARPPCRPGVDRYRCVRQ